MNAALDMAQFIKIIHMKLIKIRQEEKVKVLMDLKTLNLRCSFKKLRCIKMLNKYQRDSRLMVFLLLAQLLRKIALFSQFMTLLEIQLRLSIIRKTKLENQMVWLLFRIVLIILRILKLSIESDILEILLLEINLVLDMDKKVYSVYFGHKSICLSLKVV